MPEENIENADQDIENLSYVETAELEKSDEKNKKWDLWEQIGFERQLGGFWYNLIFMLLGLVAGIFFSGALLSIFYPYPTATGYRNTTEEIFKFTFVAFDLGTASVINRYIGEHSVKNPYEMIKYIQYFIWYQMITGLIQVTGISIYALVIVPETDLAHLVWLIVLIGSKQYPSMLNVYKSTMEGLQHFDKYYIINFIGSDIVQRFTELLFVYFGRLYGIANPGVGEIMGIAIGAIIGLYVDDFITMMLSAYYFNKMLKPYGYNIWDSFGHGFGWKFMKEPLFFGIKAGTPTLIGTGIKLAIISIFLAFIPQYTTLLSLQEVGGGIAGIVDQKLKLTAGISESYLNGKKNLTRYYIGQTWRFAGLIQLFILPILLVLIPILGDAFVALQMDNYLLAIPFFLPMIIRRIQQPYTTLADEVCTGTNHPNWLMFIRFMEEIGKLLGAATLVIWLALPEKFGIPALIWILPLYDMPAIIFKTAASWIYIEKKILKVRKHIPWWQTFGATGVSAAISTGFLYLMYFIVFTPMVEAFGFIIALLPFIFIILASIFFVYIPATAYFGGWDDGSIRTFKKSAVMSGPSKILVTPMAKLVEAVAKHTKLHNRFKQDDTLAMKEIEELMIIKEKSHADLKPIE